MKDKLGIERANDVATGILSVYQTLLAAQAMERRVLEAMAKPHWYYNIGPTTPMGGPDGRVMTPPGYTSPQDCQAEFTKLRKELSDLNGLLRVRTHERDSLYKEMQGLRGDLKRLKLAADEEHARHMREKKNLMEDNTALGRRLDIEREKCQAAYRDRDELQREYSRYLLATRGY